MRLEFAWSDDLAMLLVKEDGAEPSELSHWVSTPVAYRLPEEHSILTFARQLHEAERSVAVQPER